MDDTLGNQSGVSTLIKPDNALDDIERAHLVDPASLLRDRPLRRTA